MTDSVQYSMTTVTIEGADRAINAGEWLNTQRIDYKIEMEPWATNEPRYHFKFVDNKDATHFALRWR
jgi:hypothetical protein